MAVFLCRERKLDYSSRTLCMGILNVTPDSFSDGGNNATYEAAIRSAEEMVKAGADIIDVGGESTRPGYTVVSDDEELGRVAPVIEYISKNLDVAISVDTYKSYVAEGAIKAGAHILNDITGLMADRKIATVAKDYNAGLILMFNARTNGESAGSIIERAKTELKYSIDIAHEAGITDEYIMTDPGIGFGTTREQDAELIRNLDQLSFDKKYPVLLAASRKRVVADLMGRECVAADRDSASIGLELAGIKYGANALRVHNVLATIDAVRCYEKL